MLGWDASLLLVPADRQFFYSDPILTRYAVRLFGWMASIKGLLTTYWLGLWELFHSVVVGIVIVIVIDIVLFKPPFYPVLPGRTLPRIMM